MKYRKKPVVIEAWLFGGWDHFDASAPEWLLDHHRVYGKPDLERNVVKDSFEIKTGEFLAIHTLEGIMHAAQGDWIIQGIKGEIYPCKPDIFAATYEPVEPQ